MATTPRAILRWIAPLGLIAAWLLVFWAWYECGWVLSSYIASAMRSQHLDQDQMMAIVTRSAEFEWYLTLVALPLSYITLLWLTSRARVWTWGLPRIGGFALASILVAVLAWRLAGRFAPVRTINWTFSDGGRATTHEYVGNPLGDLLAYGAIPLMLCTTLAMRWWGQLRTRRGATVRPAAPSHWTGKDVGRLWFGVLAIEAALVAVFRVGVVTRLEMWFLRGAEFVMTVMASALTLAAIATVWWLIGRRRTPVSAGETSST
jgi:hypothetical protein